MGIGFLAIEVDQDKQPTDRYRRIFELNNLQLNEYLFSLDQETDINIRYKQLVRILPDGKREFIDHTQLQNEIESKIQYNIFSILEHLDREIYRDFTEDDFDRVEKVVISVKRNKVSFYVDFRFNSEMEEK